MSSATATATAPSPFLPALTSINEELVKLQTNIQTLRPIIAGISKAKEDVSDLLNAVAVAGHCSSFPNLNPKRTTGPSSRTTGPSSAATQKRPATAPKTPAQPKRRKI